MKPVALALLTLIPILFEAAPCQAEGPIHDAIQDALHSFKTVDIARQQMIQANDNLKAARLAIVGGASVGYSRSKQAFGTTPIIPITSYPASFTNTVTYGYATSFNPLSYGYTVSAASKVRDGEKANLAVVRNTLALQAVQAFTTLLVAKQKIQYTNDINARLIELRQVCAEKAGTPDEPHDSDGTSLLTNIDVDIEKNAITLHETEAAVTAANAAYRALTGKDPAMTPENLTPAEIQAYWAELTEELSTPDFSGIQNPGDPKEYDAIAKTTPTVEYARLQQEAAKQAGRASQWNAFGPQLSGLIGGAKIGTNVPGYFPNIQERVPYTWTASATETLIPAEIGQARGSARTNNEIAGDAAAIALLQAELSLSSAYAGEQAAEKITATVLTAYNLADASYHKTIGKIGTGPITESDIKNIENLADVLDGLFAASSAIVLTRAQILSTLGTLDN